MNTVYVYDRSVHAFGYNVLLCVCVCTHTCACVCVKMNQSRGDDEQFL